MSGAEEAGRETLNRIIQQSRPEQEVTRDHKSLGGTWVLDHPAQEGGSQVFNTSTEGVIPEDEAYGWLRSQGPSPADGSARLPLSHWTRTPAASPAAGTQGPSSAGGRRTPETSDTSQAAPYIFCPGQGRGWVPGREAGFTTTLPTRCAPECHHQPGLSAEHAPDLACPGPPLRSASATLKRTSCEAPVTHLRSHTCSLHIFIQIKQVGQERDNGSPH